MFTKNALDVCNSDNDREVRGGAGRIFHVRANALSTTNVPSSAIFAAPPLSARTHIGGATVITRLQQQQRRTQQQNGPGGRQDSADEMGSASVGSGSGSTLASGTQTPQVQRRAATIAASSQPQQPSVGEEKND